jgi:hypothetical protein
MGMVDLDKLLISPNEGMLLWVVNED